MTILLDTSAWIEFFQGTDKGRIVSDIIKTEQIFTSIITFAEITNWCLKNNIEHKTKGYIEGIKQASQILTLNEFIVISAGKLNYERKKVIEKWGIIDSLIVATSLLYGLRILTKDSDFRDLPNARVL